MTPAAPTAPSNPAMPAARALHLSAQEGAILVNEIVSDLRDLQPGEDFWDKLNPITRVDIKRILRGRTPTIEGLLEAASELGRSDAGAMLKGHEHRDSSEAELVEATRDLFKAEYNDHHHMVVELAPTSTALTASIAANKEGEDALCPALLAHHREGALRVWARGMIEGGKLGDDQWRTSREVLDAVKKFYANMPVDTPTASPISTGSGPFLVKAVGAARQALSSYDRFDPRASSLDIRRTCLSLAHLDIAESALGRRVRADNMASLREGVDWLHADNIRAAKAGEPLPESEPADDLSEHLFQSASTMERAGQEALKTAQTSAADVTAADIRLYEQLRVHSFETDREEYIPEALEYMQNLTSMEHTVVQEYVIPPRSQDKRKPNRVR